jgi:ribosomal protein L40E
MKCRTCQFENPAGMKFCGKCGIKLELVCPNCSASNPLEFQFCGECGHSLSEPQDATLLDYNENRTPIYDVLRHAL